MNILQTSTMLKVLLFSVLLAVVLAHDSSGESHESFHEKQAYCPDASSNSSVDVCSMNCPNGTNCTAMDCSSDANCTGIQKCCQTNCGMKCVDPDYYIMCGEDDDCQGNLKCCGKKCVAVCDTPEKKKEKEPECKKEKEPELKKKKKAY